MIYVLVVVTVADELQRLHQSFMAVYSADMLVIVAQERPSASSSASVGSAAKLTSTPSVLLNAVNQEGLWPIEWDHSLPGALLAAMIAFWNA